MRKDSCDTREDIHSTGDGLLCVRRPEAERPEGSKGAK